MCVGLSAKQEARIHHGNKQTKQYLCSHRAATMCLYVQTEATVFSWQNKKKIFIKKKTLQTVTLKDML